ncbi:MAG: hypothetical protein IJE46_04015 [Clostridia bacterium]|nr:hypothetical protein [Clostridia bacterium]
MKKIIWIGSYMTDEQFANLPTKSTGQLSAFTSERSLVGGIDVNIENTDYTMDTIGVISGLSFPKAEMFIKQEKFQRKAGTYDVHSGFCNFPYINRFLRGKAYKKEVKRWYENNKNVDELVVYTYGVGIGKIKAAIWLKNHIPNCRIYTIIPDIPMFVNMKNSKVWNYLKKRSEIKTKRLFPVIDGFVLYSAPMADYFCLSPEKWMLMEGSISNEDINFVKNFEKKKPNENFVMMYSGAVDVARGMPQLLQAMKDLPDRDLELWLTGKGNYVEKVNAAAKEDSRIKYLGCLDTREEVLELEMQADLLLHIRVPDAPYAPYCFPSKVFEYLATGNKVASVIMAGIPEDYYKYMIPIENFSSEGIVNAVKFAKDNGNSKENGQEFVIENKNDVVQTKRMLDFAKVSS